MERGRRGRAVKERCENCKFSRRFPKPDKMAETAYRERLHRYENQVICGIHQILVIVSKDGHCFGWEEREAVAEGVGASAAPAGARPAREAKP